MIMPPNGCASGVRQINACEVLDSAKVRKQDFKKEALVPNVRLLYLNIA